MKKIWIMVLLAVGMIACTERNTPTETSGSGDSSGDTGINDEPVDEQNWSDTIKIVWSGASATVSGANDSISITNANGYVTVNSSVTNTCVVYLLSGSGQGQLTIYGSYRHNITLNGLTLTCSDGPAINNQCHKKCYLVINGTNTLTDGSSYASTTEDRKAALFSEGQIIASGAGSLTVKGNYKHAIASDDYILFTEELTATLNLTASSDGLHANDGIYINGGTTTINAGNDGVQCDSIIVINDGTIIVASAEDKGIVDSLGITINGGTIRVTSEYKCIKTKGNLEINGGDIQVICTGAASSGGGGGPWGGGSSSSSSPEAIEAKGTITINGGIVYAQSADDAINSGSTMTINDGYVMAYSTSNDGLDANNNLYIKGGLVYAIGAGGAENGVDAKEGCTLYVQGGTLVSLGDLERGASLTQTCYYNSSWTASTWYSITVGDKTFAFKTPTKSSSSGGHGGGPGGGGSNSTPLVVSGASQPTVKSGVTVSDGTSIFNAMGYYPATVSGGSSVSLSTYSNNSGGGGGWW